MILALLLFLSPLAAQGVHPVTGRHIAGVMSAAGSSWLDRPEREEEDTPTRRSKPSGSAAAWWSPTSEPAAVS